jgi:CRISPR-associated protein Cas8a1/Csx13
MDRGLNYQLNNPNYTIYHRAALGGLAATIHAWGNKPPTGITAQLEKDSISLCWNDEVTDQEALNRILEASFKLTESKLIDLPGQGLKPDQDDLRLAIHNGICGTFLQHNKMRPGEKEPRLLPIQSVDEENIREIFTYKAVNSYAHQKAQGTGLLEPKLKGKFPATAAIPQSIVPGAMTGANQLETSADEAILLLFLMVACPVFLLRPRTYQEKAQYCVVVPDVLDLKGFVRDLTRIAQTDLKIKCNRYSGRVVGGYEEAALRFLTDLHSANITERASVANCLAIAMGKVSWDKNQINRSLVIKLNANYDELEVFQKASQELGKTKFLKSKKGEGFAIPASPIPELIAANLAAERHWCANFITLVSDKKDFTNILYSNAMKEAIKDDDDQAIISVFQNAWRLKMKSLYKRAADQKLKPEPLIDNEREKIRNALLRAKTQEALAAWLMQFCADATRDGGVIELLKNDSERIRKFIFKRATFDHFQRFQNLCLFALVSYASNAKSTAGGQE